jgi:hypothetical protein
MPNFEIPSEEFTAWLTEAERRLAELDDLDRVLDVREATLAAQAIELTGQLSAAGIDTPEALEQALAQLPDHQGTPLTEPAQSQAKVKHQMGRMV